MTQRPSPAETARTLAAGHGTACLSTPFGSAAVPVLHAGLADGEIVLLAGRAEVAALGLPTDTATPAEQAVALVDVHSYAPLPDLTLPRAHLCAAGHVRPATTDQRVVAAGALHRILGAAVRPLLSPTSDRVLLVVEVAECELHWPPGCVRIDPDDYVLAEADPLASHEGAALERVHVTCAARLLRLVRGLGPAQTGAEDLSRTSAVRPVGLDRYGLTLQCALPDGDAGLGRLAFPAPVSTAAEAEAAICSLLDQHDRCGSALP